MAVFFGYYANIVLFTHVHIIDNEVIVHAHPFATTTPSPDDSTTTPFSHSHNSLELQLLACLTNFVTAGEPLSSSLDLFIPATPIVRHITSDYIPESIIHGNAYLRGPPAITA